MQSHSWQTPTTDSKKRELNKGKMKEMNVTDLKK